MFGNNRHSNTIVARYAISETTLWQVIEFDGPVSDKVAKEAHELGLHVSKDAIMGTTYTLHTLCRNCKLQMPELDYKDDIGISKVSFWLSKDLG